MINLTNRLKRIEVTLSLLLLFIPLLLIVITGEQRSSISDYVYSGNGMLFAILLSIAAVMFLYNGWLSKKWYNIVLGLSLIGVIATPHLNYPIIHYVFAGLFFLGSIVVMILFSSGHQRKYKIIAGMIIVLGLIGHFFLNIYSLLYGEWIGMLPICIHFIGESLNKID